MRLLVGCRRLEQIVPHMNVQQSHPFRSHLNPKQYLLSDNPACAGRFLCDDYKANPHDDSNISRCKNETNEIKLKLQAIKDKISKHDVSLFSENTGELKTGLSCHHSFNNDKRYYVTSSIEKDVDRLIEYLDKAFAKYRGANHIGSKSKTSEARKRKEQRKKSKNRRLNASNNRRKFSKSIQSMKKHYFYSHQKPTKLVY